LEPPEESRKQHVIDQRREGKTIREIAKGLCISSRALVAILKDSELREIKSELSAKEEEKRDSRQTNYTKALKLFAQGKSVLDVAIKLGVTSDEAKKAYIDFCDLQTCDQFGKSMAKSRNAIRPCCPLYKTIEERGLSSNDASLALEYAENRSKAQAYLQSLNRSSHGA
jgi:uncharacterized ferredoxin-like protein